MKIKSTLVIIVLVEIFILFWLLLHNVSIPVLNPSGIIAVKERNLFLIITLLMLLVVIPVFSLTIFIVFKFREENKNSEYAPEWDHNNKLELLWWAIPCIIIFIISIIAWQSTHDLDPYKPLASSTPPITIQVVSLDWKWLFIYPKQNIAVVNFIEIPQKTPINFYITSATVMNSFWIPSLGSQIYAMPGMSTQVHLAASKKGTFYGSAANITGKGFSGMHFNVKAVSRNDFNDWVKDVQNSPQKLSQSTYQKLSIQSQNDPVSFYSLVDQNLYNEIVMKFLVPSKKPSDFEKKDNSMGSGIMK